MGDIEVVKNCTDLSIQVLGHLFFHRFLVLATNKCCKSIASLFSQPQQSLFSVKDESPDPWENTPDRRQIQEEKKNEKIKGKTTKSPPRSRQPTGLPSLTYEALLTKHAKIPHPSKNSKHIHPYSPPSFRHPPQDSGQRCAGWPKT